MPIPPGAFDYLNRAYSFEDADLKKAREHIFNTLHPIQVDPYEGRILQWLIQAFNIKKVVELGTLGGYSALWMSKALENNGKDAHLYTLEKTDSRLNVARETLKNRKNVTIIQGDASITLGSIVDKGPFDMIFIDADKVNYLTYLDWADQHIRQGGFIVADNTFLFGTIWGHTPDLKNPIRPNTLKKMQTFNERLQNKDKYCVLPIPTEDGLMIAQKL